MRRSIGALVAGLAAAGGVMGSTEDARACGGCFVPPPPPQIMDNVSVITDEKMILSISMDQTTLYDEITYSGAPASFAWVLPIKGTVTVGLSADILFQTINQLTASTVVEPPTNCPPIPSGCGGSNGLGCGSSASDSVSFPTSAAGGAGDSVTVTSQMQVGPYETVQLHSNDGSALTGWLTQHGYEIPEYTKPVVAAYVAGGFDFLALKLIPGEGVQAMQPVRVTSQGAAPSLPLHMVAVGTGAVTGITIWIVADGRWEPQNFPTFTIQDSDLSWDWATESSNYETVRQSKEGAFNGSGWQIESSLTLSQYTIAQTLAQAVNSDTNDVGGYSAFTSSGGGSSGSASSADAGETSASTTSPQQGFAFDAGLPYSLDPSVATDLGVLFAGISPPNVRITRMRSDVAKAALSVDMILEASADQSELSNQYTPAQQIGEPLCPVYDGDCAQTGSAPRSQAAAAQSSGCSTTRPQNELGTTLAFLAGFAGVAAVRARKKRR